MRLIETKISGCYEICPQKLTDLRGKFVKTFHEEMFQEEGLETHFAEEYFSVSQKGVLRGLHFQLPPYEHCKMVYCISGKVLDILVDLRVGSPTYGKAASFDLSETSNFSKSWGSYMR